MANMLLFIQIAAHDLEACHALGLEHRLHSPYKKGIIECMMEYVKDRTECFLDDYYPCAKQEEEEEGECNLSHVYKWIHLFVFMHNNNNNAPSMDDYKIDNGGVNRTEV
jgi:hypothetical protein